MVSHNSSQSFARSQSKVRAGPSGIHIFNRGNGLNVLVDEVQVPRALWAVAPRYVSVALTNACDLACPYCYAPKDRAMLDLERVAEWLKELDASGCLGVGFGGGEPTLYPHFSEICRYAVKYTGLAVSFTTHGHWLDHNLISDLKGSVHFVRVSMDGIGATYEGLRGRSFAALRDRLDLVRTLAPFGLNFVVNDCTLDDLDAATAFAAEVGAAEFLLLPERPSHGRCGIDTLTRQTLRHWVGLYRGSVSLTVSETGAEGLPTCNPLILESGLRAHAHIDAAGVVKRSSFDRDGVAIGPDGVIEALEVLRMRSGEELE
jgi:MoaA/NifB/PqqE/SkfB family radical SAM enzyme